MKWIAIAAMARNRVIGNANSIPWHLPEDFKWFKKTTLGHRLLMGRKTFESIGRPLPGRETLILSRTGQSFEGATTITLEAIDALPADDKTLFVAGGAEIYALLLPRCKELLLSRVHLEPEGDTLFPAFEEQFRLEEHIRQADDFDIERWVKD